MEYIKDPDDHLLSQGLHKLAFVYQQLNRENDAMAADEKAKVLEMGSIKSAVKRLPKI